MLLRCRGSDNGYNSFISLAEAIKLGVIGNPIVSTIIIVLETMTDVTVLVYMCTVRTVTDKDIRPYTLQRPYFYRNRSWANVQRPSQH